MVAQGMKILHIVAGVWKSSAGLATLVLGFSREQAVAGHQVQLVFLEGDRHDGVRRAEEAGVQVSTFERSFPRFLFFSWGLLFHLGKMIKQVDVVHVHSNWTFPVWWGGYLAWRNKKTLVMSPQGCFDPLRLHHSAWKKRLVGWMDRWLLRRADVIHVTCEAEAVWVREFLEPQNPQKCTKKIVVIPNGVGLV